MARPAPPAAGDPLAAVHDALARGALEAAMDAAQAALAAGRRDPLFFNLAAHRQQSLGRLAQAEALLAAGLRQHPHDVFLLCALGGCLSQQARDQEALALYRRALDLDPGHAPAHHGLGLGLAALGRADEAREAEQRAVVLAPSYPDALAALAADALACGRAAEAERYARRALAADGSEPAAVAVLAQLDLAAGAPAPALARLERRLAEPGLAPLHLAALEGLKAQALEALGEYPGELQAHRRSKAAAHAAHAAGLAAAGVELGTELAQRLRRRFATERREDWGAAPASGGGAAVGGAPQPAGHAFLIGFVRSGTTLLEQVLASHPGVAALEEQPLLRSLATAWLGDDGAIARLRALDGEGAAALRRRYWAGVAASGVAVAGKLFVDKNPLDGLFLPLVAKLFPAARIILVRRDPRDVVVSAFRHRFKVNALTAAFNDLDQTAAFYDALQHLQAIYLKRLPLAVHTLRHEDLVDDFDGEVAHLCGFLGLDWRSEMRDFAGTARRRDIRTPSAEQVRQGLSRQGLSRWRRYGEEVASILPVLSPWVEAYGYPP